jgi:sulfur carrier protein
MALALPTERKSDAIGMELYLNGTLQTLQDDLSVSGLLEQLGIQGQRVAVEVNRRIIAKSLHQQTRLNAGDRVEIIQAMGGG